MKCLIKLGVCAGTDAACCAWHSWLRKTSIKCDSFFFLFLSFEHKNFVWLIHHSPCMPAYRWSIKSVCWKSTDSNEQEVNRSLSFALTTSNELYLELFASLFIIFLFFNGFVCRFFFSFHSLSLCFEVVFLDRSDFIIFTQMLLFFL